MRRGGKEAFAQGIRKDTAERNAAFGGSPVVQPEKRHSAEERVEAGGSHVNEKSNQEGSIPIRAAVAETSPKPVSDLLHEDGMVKELVGKVEEKVPILERFGEENLITKPDFMEGL